MAREKRPALNNTIAKPTLKEKLIIQCKNYTSNIPVDDIEAYWGLLQVLNRQKVYWLRVQTSQMMLSNLQMKIQALS